MRQLPSTRAPAWIPTPTRYAESGIAAHGFSVPGVHTVDPTPQRTPLLFQAGSSERGRQFAAAHAEAVFWNTPIMQATKFVVDDVRERAEKLGRDPESVLSFPKITPIVGTDSAHAHRRFEDFLRYSSADGIFTLLGAWTGINFVRVYDGSLNAWVLDASAPLVVDP